MKRRWMSLALVIGPVAFVLAGAAMFRYVAPFVLAMLIAVLVDPWVEGLGRRFRLGRRAAVLLIVGLTVCAGTGAGFLIVAQVAAELAELVKHAPDLGMRAQQLGGQLAAAIQAYADRLPSALRDTLQRGLQSWTDSLIMELHRLLGFLRHVPDLLFVIVVAGITAYFLIRDKHVFARTLLAPLPAEMQHVIRSVWNRMARGLIGFIRAQLILITATTVGSIALFSWIGTPYPWALGMLAGFLDAMPILGPSGVFVPLIGYYLATGTTAPAIQLLLGWGVLLVFRQMAEPRLIGTHMGLHPVTALVAIYLGARSIGLAGFVLGPLAAVFLKAAFASLPPYCRGRPS